MIKLKVRKVGNSLGVTLPAEVAQALQVREGDPLYLTVSPDGFRLTPYDPEFAPPAMFLIVRTPSLETWSGTPMKYTRAGLVGSTRICPMYHGYEKPVPIFCQLPPRSSER